MLGKNKIYLWFKMASYLYVHLQASLLQSLLSTLLPGQVLPPCRGWLHILCLDFVPPLQVAVQELNCDHDVHCPSTGQCGTLHSQLGQISLDSVTLGHGSAPCLASLIIFWTLVSCFESPNLIHFKWLQPLQSPHSPSLQCTGPVSYTHLTLPTTPYV